MNNITHITISENITPVVDYSENITHVVDYLSSDTPTSAAIKYTYKLILQMIMYLIYKML